MEVCHTIFNNRLKSKKIAGHFLLLECGLLFEKNGGYLRTLKTQNNGRGLDPFIQLKEKQWNKHLSEYTHCDHAL